MNNDIKERNNKMGKITKEKAEEKKDEIYNFIVKYINKNGYAPVYREIIEGTTIKSLDTICRYVYDLKEDGRIDFVDGCARTIRIK